MGLTKIVIGAVAATTLVTGTPTAQAADTVQTTPTALKTLRRSPWQFGHTVRASSEKDWWISNS